MLYIDLSVVSLLLCNGIMTKVAAYVKEMMGDLRLKTAIMCYGIISGS